MISKLRWRIAVRDLGTEDHGKDETKSGDRSQDDDGLVVLPCEGIVQPPAFEKSKKGPSAKKKGNGDKHQR